MSKNKAADLACDVVVAHVRHQHAAASLRLAKLRQENERTVVTSTNTNRRMQLGRNLRFEEAVVRVWSTLLDQAYGLRTEGDGTDGVVVDDGGE